MEITRRKISLRICAIGAGGAGVAESAMKVAEFPFEALDCAAPTSGAGPASPSCARRATRARLPRSIQVLAAPERSRKRHRDIADFLLKRRHIRKRRGSHLRNSALARAQLCERLFADLQARRAGPGILLNCRMLGRSGRIFGGSIGAAELIKVWRG